MELIQAIKYVAVVFTICLHDMSEKKVMSFSTVIKQITEVLRLCMFKKEHCFGDKLDLQYEPVGKLTYFICFVKNLNVIQFKQLEKGFILSRFSLLCFCEYTIISLAMIPTILTLTPAMEISLWES